MSNITNLLDELKKLTELHDQLGAKITDHRNLIMDELHKDGLTQVKTPEATVSLAKRVTYSVNEPQWREWLLEQPELAEDMFYVTKLDTKKVTDYAERTLKTTGEIVPGLEPKETEYLSIRKATK
jgi:hypothetical protein